MPQALRAVFSSRVSTDEMIAENREKRGVKPDHKRCLVALLQRLVQEVYILVVTPPAYATNDIQLLDPGDTEADIVERLALQSKPPEGERS